MRLTVVGCAGSYPGPDSAASCYLVEADGPDGSTTRVVLDLGSGAIGPLQRHVDPRRLDAVLLSHLHADHCLDLMGLYVMQRHHPAGPTGRRVPVWGPSGTALRLARGYDLTEPDAMAGELAVHRWVPEEPVQVGALTVTAYPVLHPVEAYAVRVAWTGPDGRERVLAYSGDTDACDGLVEAARDADLLLCEAAFVEGRDEARGIHLTGRRAGEAARSAGARSLLVTHVPAWNDPGAAAREAREVWSGPLATARPGLVVEV
ncbi:MBL fold metallo-hydrolase [Aquipuribacter nitratireducens]|uniref:MBL fold metallo-hydrolase n=1 Tax=Aquipuribacter nitratireducens TaxID=650104 RepID=A0ABW0GR47_9MICO